MNGPLDLSWWQLAGAAALVGINGVLSLAFGLGLEKKLAIASARTLVQLTALGWILVPVFSVGAAWPVALLAVFMITLAGIEATQRSKHRFAGMRVRAIIAMAIGAALTAVFGAGVVVGVEPWWKPQYLIPLLGMMLGNSLTGVSLGLDRCLQQLTAERHHTEALLALGATRREAARPVAREALRTGMIPILNTMSAVGLVTIPGMMTGQILGGTPPLLAARYQILVMFLIAAATALGATIAVVLTLYALFDEDHRLRVERITERGS